MGHTHTLQKYSGPNSKSRCPECRSIRRTFTKYVSTETGKELEERVGRCDREQKCGYHYTPKQYFKDNKSHYTYKATVRKKPVESAEIEPPKMRRNSSFKVMDDLFLGSLSTIGECNFCRFLFDEFDPESVWNAIHNYSICKGEQWKGSTIFWQQDGQGNVRGGKIMLYDVSTGKRVKGESNKIGWVHTYHKIKNFDLRQCLFGLHLAISESDKTIGVVESAKTAVIASIAMPDLVWVSTEGLRNINASRFQLLVNRKVVLYPDQGCYEDWKDQSLSIERICKVKVSRFIEEWAGNDPSRQGADLADYILTANSASD